MKIIKLELIMVKPRWMFLKMYTDENIIGYGEPNLEGHTLTVASAVKEFEEYLVGKDPREIMHHWQVMYRGGFYRGGPVILSAISGIEQAMWDILGKSLGVPVYQLLGGACRNKIRVYTWISGNNPEECSEDARKKLKKGYTAFKLGVPPSEGILNNKKYIDRCASIIGAVREVVGKGVDIAVDFHGRLSPGMAKILIKEIEVFNPFFIEEPVLPENVDSLKDISKFTTVPIATGERIYTKWGFREILQKQAAFILQPDISHAGGIMELRSISSMAEVYYSGIAPHCPLGPIALACCLHLDTVIPNFLIQEHVTLGEGYLIEPLKLNKGYIEKFEKPGLGIELDEEFIAKNTYDGKWRTPILYYDDDSMADW